MRRVCSRAGYRFETDARRHRRWQLERTYVHFEMDLLAAGRYLTNAKPQWQSVRLSWMDGARATDVILPGILRGTFSESTTALHSTRTPERTLLKDRGFSRVKLFIRRDVLYGALPYKDMLQGLPSPELLQILANTYANPVKPSSPAQPSRDQS